MCVACVHVRVCASAVCVLCMCASVVRGYVDTCVHKSMAIM